MDINLKYSTEYEPHITEKIADFLEVSLSGSAVRGDYVMIMPKKNKSIPVEILDIDGNHLLHVRNMDELVRYALLGATIHGRVSCNSCRVIIGEHFKDAETAVRILDKYIEDGHYGDKEGCLNDERLEMIARAICCRVEKEEQ